MIKNIFYINSMCMKYLLNILYKMNKNTLYKKYETTNKYLINI